MKSFATLFGKCMSSRMTLPQNLIPRSPHHAFSRFHPLQRTFSSQPKQERLLIGFTCKICSTRSHKFMSKQAYEKGVVIIKCNGCANKHLIADHLGWFDTTKKSPGTIEDILKEKGETVQRIKFNPSFRLKNESAESSECLESILSKASPEELKEIEQGLLEYLPKVAPK